jgi:hypothetical protein
MTDQKTNQKLVSEALDSILKSLTPAPRGKLARSILYGDMPAVDALYARAKQLDNQESA